MSEMNERDRKYEQEAKERVVELCSRVALGEEGHRQSLDDRIGYLRGALIALDALGPQPAWSGQPWNMGADKRTVIAIERDQDTEMDEWCWRVSVDVVTRSVEVAQKDARKQERTS